MNYWWFIVFGGIVFVLLYLNDITKYFKNKSNKKDAKEENKMKDEEQEDNEEETETYSYDWICDNCSSEISIEIPKGKRAMDFLKDYKCDECGCITLDPEARKFNEENEKDEEDEE